VSSAYPKDVILPAFAKAAAAFGIFVRHSSKNAGGKNRVALAMRFIQDLFDWIEILDKRSD
jgi:hypothetical protein